jgi:Zn-dependent membrane protease YugP
MNTENILRTLFIVCIVCYYLSILYIKKVDNIKDYGVILGKRNRIIELPLIRRLVRLYTKSDIEEHSEESYYDVSKNKIYVENRNLLKNDVTWLATLGHEIGHARYDYKTSTMVRLHSKIMTISLLLLLLIVSIKLSLLPKYVAIILIYHSLYIFVKEVRASVFGYRIITKFYILNRKQKLGVTKYLAAAFGTYLFIYLAIIFLQFSVIK